MKIISSNGFMQNTAYLEEIAAKDILTQDMRFQEILSFGYNTTKQDEIYKIATKLRSEFKYFIIFGMGGSSLPGKAIVNLMSKLNTIYFIDNLDSDMTTDIINRVSLNETCFIFISKSGNTLETYMQFLWITQLLNNNNINIAKNCLVMTSPSESKIRKLALDNNIQILLWDGNIAGRFSISASNTLLICAISGIDLSTFVHTYIQKLKEGYNGNLNLEDINFTIASVLQKIPTSVIISYSEKASYFLDWYLQLWAESIGKLGFGTNPVKAIGTTYQHSSLQLYLDGPRDKIFTFIDIDDNPSYHQISEISEFNKTSKHLQNKTYEYLTQQGFPTRIINGNIAEIAAFLTLETILACHFCFNTFETGDFNKPYDQDAVEIAKKFSAI